jgi:hypothetical protein
MGMATLGFRARGCGCRTFCGAEARRLDSPITQGTYGLALATLEDRVAPETSDPCRECTLSSHSPLIGKTDIGFTRASNLDVPDSW